MIRFRYVSLCAIFAFLCSLSVAAQSNKDSLHLYLPAQVTAAEGQIISIPVKVRGFKDFISAQFIVTWDSTALQFITADNFGINSVTLNSHFGFLGQNPDKLRFAWLDNSLAPQNIANDNTIFNIKYKVISKQNRKVEVKITDDKLTEFEFLNKDGKEAKFSTGVPCIVDITGKSATRDEISYFDGGVAYPASPNPFRDETVMKLNITENQLLTLNIFDLSGKKIYSENFSYEVGTHFAYINKNHISSAGIYFYRLESSNGVKASGKLIKL